MRRTTARTESTTNKQKGTTHENWVGGIYLANMNSDIIQNAYKANFWTLELPTTYNFRPLSQNEKN